jgi:hypothetical protein
MFKSSVVFLAALFAILTTVVAQDGPSTIIVRSNGFSAQQWQKHIAELGMPMTDKEKSLLNFKAVPKGTLIEITPTKKKSVPGRFRGCSLSKELSVLEVGLLMVGMSDSEISILGDWQWSARIITAGE